jgi:uncharacterized membrane protein
VRVGSIERMTTGAASLVDEPTRFRADALTRVQVAAAWGLDAHDPAVGEPIRAYAPLDAARTLDQRCADLLDEVEEAAGGRLPPVVFVGSPTGSGWVNSAALTAVETWSRGRCASIALQYGAVRSQAAIPLLPLAARSIAGVIRATDQRARRAAASHDGARTKLVVWAESLGAWALLLALADDPDLLDLAMDVHVVWVGVPGPVLADPLLRGVLDRVVATGAAVATGDELDHLQLRAARSDVLLIHADDPVAHLPGVSLAWRPQQHTVPTALPAGTRIYRRPWLPLVTALRARRTLDLVTRPPSPTVLRGRHDYRYAAASALRACLQLPIEDLHVVQRLVAQRAASSSDFAA